MGYTRSSQLPVTVAGLAGAVAIALAGASVGSAQVVAPPAPRTVAVFEAGACALVGDRVACWGSNRHGLLGDGSTEPFRPAPREVPTLSGIVELAATPFTACARRGDGAVWCWGRSDSGEAGRISRDPVVRPERVQLPPDIMALGGGHEHLCAVRRTGRVLCWGSNRFRQLGVHASAPHARVDYLGPTEVPGLDGVVAVTGGQAHMCALRRDGHVVCMGSNERGAVGAPAVTEEGPFAVPGLGRVLEVTGAYFGTCARGADGAVRCWGQGEPLRELAALRGAMHLSHDGVRVCGTLPGSGAVRCAAASLGGPNPEPALVGDIGGTAGAEEVATALRGGCARVGAATVVCWGTNDSGELGQGAAAMAAPAAPVPGVSGVAELAAGRDFVCARHATGEVRCWGDLFFLGGAPREATRTGWAGRVDGDPPWSARATPTPVEVAALRGAEQITASEGVLCGRLPGGLVTCVGADARFALALGRRRDAAVVGEVATLPRVRGATMLSAGASGGCVVVRGRVRCWGFTPEGIASRGLYAPGAAVRTLAGFSAVAELDTGDGFQACVRTTAGAVECVGSTAALAEPDPPTLRPTPVPGLANAVDLSVGTAGACAVRADGRVLCWGFCPGADGSIRTEGRGMWEQIDGLRARDNPEAHCGAPVTVIEGIDDAESVHVERAVACIVRRGGRVVCFGDLGGDGALEEFRPRWPRPTEVPRVVDAAEIVAGSGFACARLRSGEVSCWGQNGRWQLGARGDAPPGSWAALPVRGIVTR